VHADRARKLAGLARSSRSQYLLTPEASATDSKQQGFYMGWDCNDSDRVVKAPRPRANCYSITVPDLTRCKTEIGRLPVGGSNQAFGHQQEGREDQGVDNRDRDYASGKAAVVVIKVCP